MTGLGLDDAQGRAPGKVTDELLLLPERVQAIRCDARHAGLRLHSLQGAGDAAPASADVVMVHRLAERHVGVRVEALRELLPLVLQVRLDGVAPALERLLLALGLPTEAPPEFVTRPVAELPEPRCDGQPVDGASRRAVVVAALERRVGADGPDLQRAQGDLIGRRRRPHGEDDGTRHPLGLADAPFEDAHAAHGPPDEAGPPIDPELVRQGDLDGHLVADGDQREAGAVRTAVRRERRGTGGPLAPAEHVRAHDVIAVRVDGRAGSDQALPPARRRMPDARGPGRMGVTRQRMQDEDRVGPGPVQLTPRLVGDRHVGKAAARPRAGTLAPRPSAITANWRRPGSSPGRQTPGNDVEVTPPSRRGTRRPGPPGCPRSTRCRRRGGRGRGSPRSWSARPP